MQKVQLELSLDRAMAEECLRRHFGEPNYAVSLLHPLGRAQSFGTYETAGSETRVQLWRVDPGMLGPAGPRFFGILRSDPDGPKVILEGRFVVAPHVRILLTMVLLALTAIGFAMGSHFGFGIPGRLTTAAAIPLFLSALFSVLVAYARRITWEEIVRALSPSDTSR